MTAKKIGILGGGQLGKMLCLAGANFHLPISILEKTANFPAVSYATNFFPGDFKKFEDVYQFGKTVDVLSIEIEHVNTEALVQLEAEGISVYPNPDKLQIIKDKGLQKLFYAAQNIPTAPFSLFDGASEIKTAIKEGKLTYPFVQKTRQAGYDGKGVAVIHSEQDTLLEGKSLVEEKVEMAMEIAVIVARNERGELRAYDPVEMAFNPVANLVEFLVCPARISPEIAYKATELAKQVITTFDICGLLAVEMFLTPSGKLLVNEVAPRPHNSGHHTIDACVTSQFEQHLRAILNWPLGKTALISPAVMVNLLGGEKQDGITTYEGLEECLKMDGVKLHLYGKPEVTPFRKMGHATILHQDLDQAIEIARKVKTTLKVKAL